LTDLGRLRILRGMARPAEQMPIGEPKTDSTDESMLLRWIERPGGRLELVELPLTPELFLDPQIGDTMVQGNWHEKTGRELMDLLEEHFRPQSDVLVTHDMKHLYGPGFPAPAPDLAVIRGIQDRDADRPSFDVLKEGLLPCLVIEVVSRSSSRIRNVDVERKVVEYARIGISEYLIVDTPKGRRTRYTLLGYRLDAQRRYQPIEADAEGRILSQTAGLWFQISADRKQVLVFEFPSGRRLLTPTEWKALAVREEEARRAAEAELARLREELERLRGES
jgi:Uma2 family endonuclease